MAQDNAVSPYAAEYEELCEQLPGQHLAWLQQIRGEAHQQFSQCGFPTLRDEEWRYTNVSPIEKKLFSAKPPLADADIQIGEYQLSDCWRIVLVDGYFNAALSDLSGLPESVAVMSMAEALDKHDDTIKAHLGQAVSDQEHGLVAFNTSRFGDGLFIQIPAGQALDKPIQLINVMSQTDHLAHTRNLVILEAQAEAQIIETAIGDNNAYLSAAVSEVFVGENAALEWFKLQADSEKAYHFSGTYVKQSTYSRFKHHNFSFGGLLARNDIHCDIQKAAECELNGLFLAQKRQHIDNHTRINHCEPHGISREQYKGVLNQRARGVFQGRVIVAEDAQKTDSEMNNRNLLLSDDAEIDTKPQLEIYADDVKCAHGVTVGQLDEQSVFYLKSRCIDEASARNMLTFAFANEMVTKIAHQGLHDLLLSLVLERFPQTDVSAEWL